MPFKDKEKERAWRRKYWAERPKQRKAITARFYAKHREEILGYMKEYTKRPEVIERRKKYYLENRTEILANNKKNKMLKNYEQKTSQSVWKRRKAGRDFMRRKRNGISIQRTENGYFWKSGKISNGPFNYLKEAIKDAEEAFLL